MTSMRGASLKRFDSTKRLATAENDISQLEKRASSGPAFERLEAIAYLEECAASGRDDAALAVLALSKIFSERFPDVWQSKDWSRITPKVRLRFASALERVDPDWCMDFAAAAAVGLSPSERKLRGRLIDYLIRNIGSLDRGFEAIGRALDKLKQWNPRNRSFPRRSALSAVLDTIAGLDGLSEGNGLADALTNIALILEPPAQGREIVRMAGKVSAVLVKVRGRLPNSDIQNLTLGPLLVDAVMASGKGALARPLEAAVWQQLVGIDCSTAKVTDHKPPSFTTKDAVLHDLDKLAASLFQLELGARNAFVGSANVMAQAFETVRQTDPDLAQDFKRSLNRQRRVMQGIRDLARFRAFEADGTNGEIIPYDAERHELVSHTTRDPVRVKVLEAPIVSARDSNTKILVKRGEVEAAD